jgi:hypothetical protein
MNTIRNIFNRYYYFTYDIHRITCIASVMTGSVIGLNNGTEKYNNYGKDGKILSHVILSTPEIIVGGVCGYFWMYTLLPYSFYKRYQYNKENKNSN